MAYNLILYYNVFNLVYSQMISSHITVSLQSIQMSPQYLKYYIKIQYIFGQYNRPTQWHFIQLNYEGKECPILDFVRKSNYVLVTSNCFNKSF